MRSVTALKHLLGWATRVAQEVHQASEILAEPLPCGPPQPNAGSSLHWVRTPFGWKLRGTTIDPRAT